MQSAGTLILGDIRIDLDAHEVVRQGEQIALTPTEGDLLRYLAAQDGAAVSRADLLTEVWGYSPNAKTRAVDFAVRRLRQKIEPEPSEPTYLLSVYGVGYRLDVPETAPTHDLVGRDEVLSEILDTLGRHSLVTLLGPGGVGKTALAKLLARHFGWPLIRVDAVERGGLIRQVAAGLDLDHAATLDATSVAIARRLRGRTVILDNLEQLVPHTEDIGRWCAHGAVLATSRIPLDLPSEAVLRVPPLSEADAGRLFARLVAGADDGEVQDIVPHLDGLPLAIELAAARSRLLGLKSLAERLERPLDVLRGASDGKHASLQRVLDDTYELLEPDQRRVLRWCAVFSTGFTVGAAEAVIGAEALTALEVLEQHQLIRLAANQTPPRLVLPETVRSFAAQKLREEDAEAATEAHLRWLMGLARQHPEALGDWMEDLWAALEREEQLPVPLLLAGLETLDGRIPTEQLVDVLERGISMTSGDERSRLGSLLGRCQRRLGDSEQARTVLQRALDAAQSDAARADCLHALASVEVTEGRLEEGESLIRQALALPMDDNQTAIIQSGLGIACLRGRRHQEAEQHLREALDRVGTRSTTTALLVRNALANLCTHTGRFPEAAEHYEAALALSTALGRRSSLGVVLQNLGLAALHLGELDRALDLFRQAVSQHTTYGRERSRGIALGNLARALFLAGDPARARATVTEAIEVLRQAGQTERELFCRMVLAWVEAAEGREEAAAYQRQQAHALGEVSGALDAVVEAYGLRARSEPVPPALLDRLDPEVHAEAQHLARM